MKTFVALLLAVLTASAMHLIGDVNIIDAGATAFATAPLIAHVQRPDITAMATETNGAYLNKFLLPQLVKEYQNDKEDFLALLNSVPKGAVGTEGIYKNKLTGNVETVINNAVDFVAPANNPDKAKLFVPWDTVDTKPQGVSRSDMRGLPYDIKAAIRVNHMKAIKRATRDKLLHAVAPAAAIELAGNTMSYDALVKASTGLKEDNVDLRDCMVIFSPKHVEDLAIEQGGGEKFRERMYDEAAGKPKGFAGFKNVFEHNNMPKYDDAAHTLNAFGSVAGTDATLIIHIPEVIFHREAMAIYYKEAATDTRSADPTDEFRLGGFFAADILEDVGFRALV